MFTERYSYPDHAAPIATSEQPFFLVARVPIPEMSKEPNSLGRKILPHWEVGEMELAKMSQDKTQREAFQNLFDKAAYGKLLSHRDVANSFRYRFCDAEDVKEARAAMRVGTGVEYKWAGNLRWKFTESELAQLLVAIVIKNTYVSEKHRE